MIEFEPCELVDFTGKVFHCCVERDEGRILFLRFREGLDDQPEVHQDLVHRGWEPVYRKET